MKKRTGLFIVTIACAVLCKTAFSQVVITGPACVTTGTIYQYNISAKWDSVASYQVCISGGTISDSGTTCISSMSLPFVHVSWDSAATQGSITIVSANGNGSLAVNVSPVFLGGAIDSSGFVQVVDTLTVPGNISCTAATGGNCSPNYHYQWQQSPDYDSWTTIPGATGQNLAFTAPFSQTTYVRRVVTEQASGSINYSNVATIIVVPSK